MDSKKKIRRERKICSGEGGGKEKKKRKRIKKRGKIKIKKCHCRCRCHKNLCPNTNFRENAPSPPRMNWNCFIYSTSMPSPVAAITGVLRFSLTYPTKSSSTPGHAPSSDHQDMDSSPWLFCTNTPVWSHMSLLTPFRHFSSRNSIHQSSQGVLSVFHLFDGA